MIRVGDAAVAPDFPVAAKTALANVQLRRNVRHATTVIRDKRAAVVGEMTDWEELRDAGAAIALYPLSAFRAMNDAALDVYRHLRKDGTQKAVVGKMQTRDDLYKYLGYHDYEQKLDALFAKTR